MLTEKTIQAALKNTSGERTLGDGSPGRGGGSLALVVRKLAGGGVSAQWYIRWKRAGQRRRKSLGRYPAVSLRDARARFAELTGALQDGREPAAVAHAADAPTVERLFTGYVAAMRQAGRVSAGEVERVLLGRRGCAADVLGRQRPAGDVGPGDIAAVLAPMWNSGNRVMADRARSYLSAAFGWGVKAEHDYRAERRIAWGIKTNPVRDVVRDTSASKPRDRALTAQELRALWLALDGPGFAPETACAVRLLICCGQRVRETLRARAADFDLGAGVWVLPAANTKGRRAAHVVPLPRQAVEAVRQLREIHPSGALFPGRSGGLMADASIMQALERWAARAGVPQFQARDLRRTWKTRAADAGVDRFTRDLIQQHARGDTGSRHYDRADYMPQMREAMKKWETWLDVVLK